MSKKDESDLLRAELIDGIRTKVAYELRSQKRRVLNEVETEAVKRFDAALGTDADLAALKDELLDAPTQIRAQLS